MFCSVQALIHLVHSWAAGGFMGLLTGGGVIMGRQQLHQSRMDSWPISPGSAQTSSALACTLSMLLQSLLVQAQPW